MSTDRFSLEGRRALVTGASSGIGRAIALGLAEHGAGIVLHHFGDTKGAAGVAQEFDRDTPVMEADFTDTAAAAAFADDVLANHGPIDILIANAAIERRMPWHETSPEHVEAHIAANFTSLLTLTRRLVPAMVERGWGRVVATGSVMATRPRAESVVYASVKAAQLVAMRAIGREVAGRGVTMNVVSPGAIETEATAHRYADATFRRAVVAKIPMGRQGGPDDLVGAFVFLCSDAASYVTGADIPVDGGWTIGDAPGALPGEGGMTGAPKISVFHDGRDRVGESPLWDAGSASLWWVDIEGKALRRKHVASGRLASFDLDIMPGALALDEDGSVIVAAGAGWYRFDAGTGALSLIAEVTTPRPEMRMNDGVVDPAGRFWSGTMHMPPEREPVGTLYAFDGGRAVATVEGLRTQNGCAISPDGKTFYLADSHPAVCTIWAFDLDVDTGALANRRVFHKPSRGRPDGACVDADGCYWFAAVEGGCITRLDPDGNEIASIDLPVSRPTKPAFGGDDLSTIFVTSMSTGLDAAQLAREPLAGSVLAVEAGMRGFAQPRFRRIPARQAAAAGS